MPRKTKYKKQHKGSKPNKINNYVSFEKKNQGFFILKSQEFGRVSEKQIQACKMTIRKNLKKKGKLFILVQADIPISKKPIEIRMGKGKGSVDKWVSKIKIGTPLFKIQSRYKRTAIKAFMAAQIKMPLFTKIVKYA